MMKIVQVLFIFLSSSLLAMDQNHAINTLNFKRVYKASFCAGKIKKIEQFARCHVSLSKKRDLEFTIEQLAQINQLIEASGCGISGLFC